jgi:ADP-heptose:LPS heptosyltransferase
MYSNLNNGIYDELFDELKSYKKIAFIGTKEESYCPDRAADLRGVGLSRLADVMASSSLVMGGSSGPIHFASLCGTPHLTWGGYRLRTFFRYAWDWNPFQVPCHIFENTSQMSYLKGRIKLWKNVPRNLLDLEHLNVVHSESYRQPTFKDLLHNINKILDE